MTAAITAAIALRTRYLFRPSITNLLDYYKYSTTYIVLIQGASRGAGWILPGSAGVRAEFAGILLLSCRSSDKRFIHKRFYTIPGAFSGNLQQMFV
jgi:hypothetical protein